MCCFSKFMTDLLGNVLSIKIKQLHLFVICWIPSMILSSFLTSSNLDMINLMLFLHAATSCNLWTCVQSSFLILSAKLCLKWSIKCLGPPLKTQLIPSMLYHCTKRTDLVVVTVLPSLECKHAIRIILIFMVRL